MNAREWLAAYAEKLGTDPPTTEEFKVLLDVAGEAAHSSERVAAPGRLLAGGEGRRGARRGPAGSPRELDG